MEYWDIYDAERRKTGKTMLRGDKFPVGAYHLVVHICIFNKKGEMLIQRRQSFKEGWPGLWDITVGGSAIMGDSSQKAAERELYEELGIKVSLSDIRPKLTINFDCGFDDIYLIEKEIEISELKLQFEEVQDARWATKEEIIRMIENKEFIPYYPSLINLFFEIRGQYGCFRKEG